MTTILEDFCTEFMRKIASSIGLSYEEVVGEFPERTRRQTLFDYKGLKMKTFEQMTKGERVKRHAEVLVIDFKTSGISLKRRLAGFGITNAVDALQQVCYGEAYRAGWHTDPATGDECKHNMGQLLMLVTSELAEALEADRKNLKDDHLPDRSGVEVELADALIRIFDMATYLELDIAGALHDKLLYNANRADHKLENRALTDGKKY